MKYFGVTACRVACAALLLSGLFLSFTVVTSTARVSAHRDGCHRWHSCPSDTGSYVCGDLGYYSECPSSAPTPQPKVAVPRITTKTLTADEKITFKTSVRWTNNEYRGYSKVQQVGVDGLKRIHTDVTYTNGVESSRAPATSVIVTPPVDQIVTQGRRTKPVAIITKVTNHKDNDKVTIWGKYKAHSEVVLAVDGKRIKRTKTDNKGKFVFVEIKIPKSKYSLEVYKRVDGKESRVAEKYYVDKGKQTLISDYQRIHSTRQKD